LTAGLSLAMDNDGLIHMLKSTERLRRLVLRVRAE
jgi:hypothetical protein